MEPEAIRPDMISIDSRRVETETCLECFEGRRECLLPAVDAAEPSFAIATDEGPSTTIGAGASCREDRLTMLAAAEAAGGGKEAMLRP